MSSDQLSEFRLLGHDCPMGCYPGPVVPIGKLAGRLVAIYHSEEGSVEAVEVEKSARFVTHDLALAAHLSSYNPSSDLLFAISPGKVESYSARYEKVEFLRFRQYSDDPFYRLTLSSATDSLTTIEQDVKACLRSISATAPELAPIWYADWRLKLRSREHPLNLPTDFRYLLGPHPSPTAYTSSPDPSPRAESFGSKSLIRLEGIYKIFERDEMETHALIDINLSIDQGEYIIVGGPSGCGKSSLLAILGLLESPTRGNYYLRGIPVSEIQRSELARLRNREVGLIFQAFNLIGDLNAYENVELPLTYRGMASSDRRKKVHEALERVGMLHRLKHYPSQLSGGQQQRIAVARALAGDPSILLADEPTGNLDSQNGAQVMALLRELHRGGATICMVTHDPRYWRDGNRLVNMFDGRIVEEVNTLSLA